MVASLNIDPKQNQNNKTKVLTSRGDFKMAHDTTPTGSTTRLVQENKKVVYYFLKYNKLLYNFVYSLWGLII